MGAAPDPRGPHHGRPASRPRGQEMRAWRPRHASGRERRRPSQTGWELGQSQGWGHQWEGHGPVDVLELLGSTLEKVLGRMG